MTPNLIKADTETLEALLQKESELYQEALKKDVPFKFIKAIHLRVKSLSSLLLKKTSKKIPDVIPDLPIQTAHEC